MSLHNETDIYAAVVELAKYIARITADLRRDIKPTYGKMLVDESTWMAVLVRHANIAREAAKVPYFEQLLEQVEIVQFTLRILLDLGWLPRETFARSLPLTASIGKQATALRNHFAPAP